jgi:23S rRNA (uracil1939-C5)-methyltransferase
MPLDEAVALQIDDVAFGGRGVGRLNGKVMFVPFAIPGEQVTARILRTRKNFSDAELISVNEPSRDRVESKCPYFGRCGGCAYQHIHYGRQLTIKRDQVEQVLRRIGKIDPVPLQPIVSSPLHYGYRNRIRVHARNGAVGFFAWEKSEIVDIAFCPISTESVNSRLRDLRSKPLGDGHYTVMDAESSSTFFTQTNPSVADELLALVHRTVARDHSLLIDAYCGAGFFAKHLRELFTEVIGIEENENAVNQSRNNAAPNEKYICGDVGRHLINVLGQAEAMETTLLLDPPSSGVSARVVDAIFSNAPAEILYVSCNPATLARDLAILCRIYSLVAVTPLDMFPQTAEIEVVAHLRKSSVAARFFVIPSEVENRAERDRLADRPARSGAPGARANLPNCIMGCVRDPSTDARDDNWFIPNQKSRPNVWSLGMTVAWAGE